MSTSKMNKSAGLMGPNSGLRKALTDLAQAPIHNKIGLTIGSTGLALSIANNRANAKRMHNDDRRSDIEQKSLKALEKIHNAIESGKMKLVVKKVSNHA